MLLIIKEGEFMIVTKQNPAGGPTLKSYPIKEDPDTGTLGYQIGYCSCGCGKPIMLRTIDVRDIVNKFGFSLIEYEAALKKLKPKVPFRKKLVNAITAWGERD